MFAECSFLLRNEEEGYFKIYYPLIINYSFASIIQTPTCTCVLSTHNCLHAICVCVCVHVYTNVMCLDFNVLKHKIEWWKEVSLVGLVLSQAALHITVFMEF